MRILILGGDGYLGWPTAMRFSAAGHEVSVVDNFSRRRWHTEHSTDSLTPIRSLADRIEAWREVSGNEIHPYVGSIEDFNFLDGVIAETLPEAIVHYGEQPSAPYSMKSREAAVETQYTNVIGTLNLLFAIRDRVPDCHLVKLGTMGEYGTPEHRHRGGVHRDRAQGPQGHAAVPEAARLALPPLEGPRLPQHPLRLPDLGPARHRPEPGRRLRDRDRRVGRRRAPAHPLRLRRVLRHRAQPLLRAGRDRPPAHRLRRGRPDARLPQHPRHAPVRRAGGRQPGRARRVPGLQPVHRAVLGRRARRARPRAAPRSGSTSTSATTRTRGSRPSSTTTTPPTRSSSTSASSPTYLGEELVRSMLGIIERHRDRVIERAILPRTRWKPGELAGEVRRRGQAEAK